MTIKDLAVKTGYAVGTVSRALNNHPNVSAKAREAILMAAQECGFELNVNAKQLKQQSTNNILVVVKGIGNELFGELEELIQSRIAQTRYQLIVDFMDEDSNEVLRAVSLIREKKPLGILFLGGNSSNFVKDFDKIEVPCVLVTNDAATLRFPNLSSVAMDERDVGARAIETLIGMGHRNIAVIGGDRELSDTSRLRYEGCLKAFFDHNIPFVPEQDYQSMRFSYKDGYEATRRLMENGRKYTAIFAMADVIAIGAIRGLRDFGLRVPEDVSVMGVDGLPISNYLTPQLATVCQPTELLAQSSVDILLDAIENRKTACHKQVEFQVLSRESIRDIR